eukprot:scaffold145676_cov30-Tisochrysis_lutea.AAC.1
MGRRAISPRPDGSKSSTVSLSTRRGHSIRLSSRLRASAASGLREVAPPSQFSWAAQRTLCAVGHSRGEEKESPARAAHSMVEREREGEGEGEREARRAPSRGVREDRAEERGARAVGRRDGAPPKTSIKLRPKQQKTRWAACGRRRRGPRAASREKERDARENVDSTFLYRRVLSRDSLSLSCPPPPPRRQQAADT